MAATPVVFCGCLPGHFFRSVLLKKRLCARSHSRCRCFCLQYCLLRHVAHGKKEGGKLGLVDCYYMASIPLYFIKGYVFTSFQFLILLAMAFAGLFSWH